MNTPNRNIPRLSPPDVCLCSTIDEIPCQPCLDAYARWLEEDRYPAMAKRISAAMRAHRDRDKDGPTPSASLW